jgi:hypothetical protein
MTEEKEACVYCGATDRLSRDHIPPKNLFPKPRPDDLITVPSCKRCNQGNSKDDTYFRDMLVLRHDLSENPLVQALIGSVLRSFNRTEGEKYFRSLYSKLGQHDARTKQGIYVGPQPTVEVDLNRILKVIKRIVRGLHYHENNSCLSPDYEVYVFTGEYFEHDLTWDQREVFLKAFVVPVLAAPQKVIGGGVFKYKVGRSNKRECCVWAFLFFDKVPFIAVTLPKDRIHEKEGRNSKYPPGFYE